MDWVADPPQQDPVTYPSLPSLPAAQAPLQSFRPGSIPTRPFAKLKGRKYQPPDPRPKRSISVPTSPSRQGFGTSNSFPRSVAERASLAASGTRRKTYGDHVREVVARNSLQNLTQNRPRQTSAPPTPTLKRRSFEEYQQDAAKDNTVVEQGRVPSSSASHQTSQPEVEARGSGEVEDIVEEEEDSAWKIAGDIVVLSVVTISEQSMKLSRQLFRAYEAMTTGEQGRRNLRNVAMIRELFIKGGKCLLSTGCTIIIKSVQTAAAIAGTGKRRLVEYQSRWDRMSQRALQQPSRIQQPNNLPPNSDSYLYRPPRIGAAAIEASSQDTWLYTPGISSKSRRGPIRKARSNYLSAPYSISKDKINAQRARKAQRTRRSDLSDEVKLASIKNLTDMMVVQADTVDVLRKEEDSEEEEMVKNENLPAVKRNFESSRSSRQFLPHSTFRVSRSDPISQSSTVTKAAHQEVAIKLETPLKSVLKDEDTLKKTPLSELSSNLSSVASTSPPPPPKQVTWKTKVTSIRLFQKGSRPDNAWFESDEQSTIRQRCYPVRRSPNRPLENPIKSILKETDGQIGYDEGLRQGCYPADNSFEGSTFEDLSIQETSPEASDAQPQTPPNKDEVGTPASPDGLTISTRRSSKRQQALLAKKHEEDARRREEEARREASLAAAKVQREAILAREKALREEEERKAKGLRRIPTSKLILPLSVDWDKKVDDAMAASSNSHQVATTVKGIPLTRKDFGTLLPQLGRDSPSAWVNDDIILAYLQAIVDFQLKKVGYKRGQVPKYHAFSTFFYKNLSEKGVGSVDRWAKRAGLEGERLLLAEQVFIPIHQQSHWTLLVVSPMRRTIEYFDSFHGDGKVIIDKTKEYLRSEVGPAFKPSEWKVHTSAPSPTQYNGKDCGVFLATTAKMIALGYDPAKAYTANDIAVQRRRMAAELINGGFVGDFAPIE